MAKGKLEKEKDMKEEKYIAWRKTVKQIKAREAVKTS
jgi:hypothetical protein